MQSECESEWKSLFYLLQKNEQQMDFVLLFKCLFPLCISFFSSAIHMKISLVGGGQKIEENFVVNDI